MPCVAQQLQELTVSNSSIRMGNTQDAFAAVSVLTNLRALSFEGNGGLAQASQYRVTLCQLLPLMQLTRLVLPAVTYDKCSQEYLQEFVADHATLADCAGVLIVCAGHFAAG